MQELSCLSDWVWEEQGVEMAGYYRITQSWAPGQPQNWSSRTEARGSLVGGLRYCDSAVRPGPTLLLHVLDTHYLASLTFSGSVFSLLYDFQTLLSGVNLSSSKILYLS